MKLLELHQVTIGHTKGAPLLPPISLTLGKGDLLGVLGPNGAGKSTLLKTMLGLLSPLGGALGYPLGRKPRLGYVPQGARPDFAYPLSVLQVALMGRAAQLGLVRRPKQADFAIAQAQLERVGLGALAQRPFRSLSGGQQQRALVARALTAEPELLVLDEPTSEMDPAAEHGLLSLVSTLVSARDIAVVFVTHEISAAASFAANVILLNAHQKFVATGPAAELITSQTMSELYGHPIEVRREDARTLVWLSGSSPASAGGAR